MTVTVSAARDSGTSTCDAETTIDSVMRAEVQHHRDVPHLVARQHDRHRVGGEAVGDDADVVAAGAQAVDDEMAGGVGRAFGDGPDGRGDHDTRARAQRGRQDR